MNIKTRRLPPEYQEVEYIESHGTEYIDTGLAHASSFEFTFTCDAPEITSVFWGFYDETKYTYVQKASEEKTIRLYNQTYNIPYSYESGVKKTISNTIYDYDDNINYYIFGLHLTNGAVPYKSIYKFNNLIFYDSSNVAIRNFIPCYRKSDSEIGLYDLVNGVFYTNSGTGTFTKGPDVVTVDEWFTASRLPDGYQELEYVESDGTGQYINLNNTNTFTSNDIYETEYNFCALSNNVMYITGVNFAQYSMYIDAWISAGWQTRSFFANNSSSGILYGPGVTIGEINTFYYKGTNGSQTQILNGVATSKSSIISVAECNIPLYIFAQNGFGTATGYFHGRIYPSKTKDYILIKFGTFEVHLVPAKRLSDSEVGMYDLVNNVFYTNQGTGAFTAGPIVNHGGEVTRIEDRRLVFNQLTEHGNFDSDNGWIVSYGSTKSFSNNIATLNSNTNTSFFFYRSNYNVKLNDIWYERADVKGDSANGMVEFSNASKYIYSDKSNITTEWQTIRALRKYTVASQVSNTNVPLYFNNYTDTLSVQVKNFMAINLTEMYGAGYEPTDPAVVEADCAALGHPLTEYQEYTPIVSFNRLLWRRPLKFNQLISIDDILPTFTIYGITFTNNGDGSVTANGTSTQSSSIRITNNIHFFNGRKYLLKGGFNFYLTACNGYYVDGYDSGDGAIITNTHNNSYVYYVIPGGYSGHQIDNITKNLMLIDLTEMYGAGNEPTDVATVEADCKSLGHDLSTYQPYTPIE